MINIKSNISNYVMGKIIPRASENDTESINHYINNLKKLNKKLIKISMPT